MLGSDNDTIGIYNLAAAAIQGASSIGASVTSYKASKRLMEHQNEMNIENWKMQNEYNSPKSQMQRLSEANLNPNLVYGNGNAITPASAVQGVSNHQFKVDAPNFLAAFQLGLQKEQLNMQKEIADSVIVRNLSDAEKMRAEAHNERTDYPWHQARSQWSYSIFAKEVDLNEAQRATTVNLGQMYFENMNLLKARTDLTNEQKSLISKQVSTFETKFNLWVKQTNAGIDAMAKNAAAYMKMSEANAQQVKNAFVIGMKKLGIDARKVAVLERLAPSQIAERLAHADFFKAQSENVRNFGKDNFQTLIKWMANYGLNGGVDQGIQSGDYIPQGANKSPNQHFLDWYENNGLYDW